MNSKFSFPILFIVASFITTSNLFCQISFEKGYFIDNKNYKTDCYIKNVDWKNNPHDFLYKIENESLHKKATIDSVKEFGIYGYSKYIRVNTLIDRSSNDVREMSESRVPIWSKEQVFLKVLIEGAGSLYNFQDKKINRFFYSVNDTSINQLVYKQYWAPLSEKEISSGFSKSDYIASNNYFRQQLWANLKCPKTNQRVVETIEYNQKELSKYFKVYNLCVGVPAQEYNTTKKDFINLKISSGINVSSVSVGNDLFNSLDFSGKNIVSLSFGLEGECLLPFNKNKWGILLAPTFQNLKYEGMTKNKSMGKAQINYSSVEFPFGIRHYFFLNKNMKLFLNGFYCLPLSLNFEKKISFESSTPLEIIPSDNFSFGGGVEYKRISMEYRYYTRKNILSNYGSWGSDYRRFSIMIGYKIFRKKA